MRDPLDNSAHTGIAMLGMAALSVPWMLLHPRRTGHMLAGGGWYDDHCSCTRVPDAMNPTCAVHGDQPHG